MTGAGQEADDPGFIVVGQPVMPMEATQPCPVTRRSRSAEVHEMKRAAGRQHAANLARRSLLLRAIEVMEHERRKDAIERPVGTISPTPPGRGARARPAGPCRGRRRHAGNA
jgi:hypothetical protein